MFDRKVVNRWCIAYSLCTIICESSTLWMPQQILSQSQGNCGEIRGSGSNVSPSPRKLTKALQVSTTWEFPVTLCWRNPPSLPTYLSTTVRTLLPTGTQGRRQGILRERESRQTVRWETGLVGASPSGGVRTQEGSQGTRVRLRLSDSQCVESSVGRWRQCGGARCQTSYAPSFQSFSISGCLVIV